MSKTSGQKDPSMDEILGSIRRIISEDNAQSGATAGTAEDTAAGPEDDILELTDTLEGEAEPEVRREPVLKPVEAAPHMEDGSGVPGERREPVLGVHNPPAAAADEDSAASVEPTTMTSVSGEEQAPAEPTTEAEIEPAAAVAAEKPPPESAPLLLRKEPAMAESDEPPAAPAEQPRATGEDIVSETTSTATTAALGELSRAMEEKVGRLRLGEGNATVSDIVKELLRPMLKDWIDQNLPMIVERVVRREIQKLVDRAPDDD